MTKHSTMLLVRWTLLVFGVLVLGVSAFADRWMNSLGENLAWGYGTVERLYELHVTSSGSSRKDYHADVRMPQLGGETLRVDLLKAQYRKLKEGSELAVVWDRTDSSHNIAGEHVDRLVSGEITSEEFMAGQMQVLRWAYIASGIFLVSGCLSFMFRAK